LYAALRHGDLDVAALRHPLDEELAAWVDRIDLDAYSG
jgi:hypothetical protein